MFKTIGEGVEGIAHVLTKSAPAAVEVGTEVAAHEGGHIAEAAAHSAESAARATEEIASTAARVEEETGSKAATAGARKTKHVYNSQRTGLGRNADRIGIGVSTVIGASTASYLAVNALNRADKFVQAIPEVIGDGLSDAEKALADLLLRMQQGLKNPVHEAEAAVEEEMAEMKRLLSGKATLATQGFGAVLGIVMVGATIYVVYRGVNYLR